MEEFLKPLEPFVIIIGVILIIAAIALSWYLISKDAKEGKERKLEEIETEKRIKSNTRRLLAFDSFGIDFDEDDKEQEKNAHDEIIRLVNLEAVRVAEACVKQDKINRGVGGEDIDRFYDYHVADLKADWAKKRKNALILCPDLKDRLFHFSEFEPLKSYNAKHLLKKKSKASN